MLRSKFLASLLAVMSIVIVGAVAFGIIATVKSPAHAAAVTATTHTSPKITLKSKPRYVHYHANFTDSALTTTKLQHWVSSFTAEGKTWKYSMVDTNPSLGSVTTIVPATIVPTLLKFSNGKSFVGTPQVSTTTSSPLFQVELDMALKMTNDEVEETNDCFRITIWSHISPIIHRALTSGKEGFKIQPGNERYSEGYDYV